MADGFLDSALSNAATVLTFASASQPSAFLQCIIAGVDRGCSVQVAVMLKKEQHVLEDSPVHLHSRPSVRAGQTERRGNARYSTLGHARASL